MSGSAGNVDSLGDIIAVVVVVTSSCETVTTVVVDALESTTLVEIVVGTVVVPASGSGDKQAAINNATNVSTSTILLSDFFAMT